MDVQGYYDTAVALAKKAGEIAREAYFKEKQVQTKSCSSDLVTETDRNVEDFLISSLRSKYPTHRFIGEETTVNKQEFTGAPTWMIDPIDGTSNFVHKFPFTCVSIGLIVNKEAVAGVVYNFVLDQLFAAKKGEGATMNGSPITVSKCRELSRSLVITELGSCRDLDLLKPKIDTLQDLASEPNAIHGSRSLGSAALNCCMVATGSADAYYEYGLHCWDIAAAHLIVKEAGGVCMYPTGEPLHLMKRGMLCAATEDLALQLVPHIKYVPYPED